MTHKPSSLITPGMVRDYAFPSREFKLPSCFRRIVFDSPHAPPKSGGLMPYVGVTVGSKSNTTDAFLPVAHLAFLVELCRFRLRVGPSYQSLGKPRRGFYPRSYGIDVLDYKGRPICFDVKRLWWRSRETGKQRAELVDTAANGWRAEHGFSLADYSGNLWDLLNLADSTTPSRHRQQQEVTV